MTSLVRAPLSIPGPRSAPAQAGAGRLVRGPLSSVRRWDAPDADAATPTLVCLPPAGAQSLFFRPLAGHFADINVAAVDFPGHGSSRVDPLTRVQDVAAEVAQWVRDEFPGPVVFLGHSYGGYIAYETIRQLQRDGHASPLALAIVCNAAPGVEVLKELPADDAECIELFSGHGGVPAALLEHPELLAPAIAMLRADLQSATDFSMELDLRAPLELPTVLVAAEDDDLVRPEMMLPWSRLIPAADYHVVPGGHFPPRDTPEVLVPYLAALLESVAVSV